MNVVLVLPIDRNDPKYAAYCDAFEKFCKYEEGTQPPEIKEEVVRTYKEWVNANE